MTRARWVAVTALLLLSALATPAWSGGATCLTGTDPETAGDPGAIVRLRDAIAASCPCGAYDGTAGRSRGAYLACARGVIDAHVASGALRPQCRAYVRRLGSAAVCGRPAAAGAAPCVRRSDGGKVSCTIKAPALRCADRPGQEQQACPGFTHCIDAADSNGDLLVDARDTGVCNPAPSPSPRPAATPTPRATAAAPQPFPTGSGGALLALLVNQYRLANGKSPVPITPTMMAVAGAHVADLVENPEVVGPSCNLHSWSSTSMWSGCCYDASHTQATCMWSKPGEIGSALGYARYTGNGFELAYRGWYSTPEMVLDFFTRSSAHRAVLLNQQGWASYDPFPAMGAAMRGEFAVIWFGSANDPEQ
ncbi:MAG: hypothetical protein AB1689_14230 [Thermodesulfobacteriota bacterium]